LSKDCGGEEAFRKLERAVRIPAIARDIPRAINRNFRTRVVSTAYWLRTEEPLLIGDPTSHSIRVIPHPSLPNTYISLHTLKGSVLLTSAMMSRLGGS
jgi:hypothetical protein